jgi:hypothetical protein
MPVSGESSEILERFTKGENIMLASAVFAVIITATGANPSYTIINEVKAQGDLSAFKTCVAAKEELHVTAEQRAKIACIELLLHDNHGDTFERTIPPTDDRVVSHQTSWKVKP